MKPPGEKRYFHIKAPIIFFLKTYVEPYPVLEKYNLFQMLQRILKPFSRAVWKDDA